ncbi:hypothetical protein ACFL7E_01280 [Thermodesulfobacteriota bacterium]
MKKVSLKIAMGFLITVFSFASVSFAVEGDSDLVKALLGEWKYYKLVPYKEAGTITFDSVNYGTIDDFVFGIGSFRGNFTKKKKYEAELTFPDNPELKGQTFKMVLKFKKMFDDYRVNGNAKSAKYTLKVSDGAKVKTVE